MAYMWPDKHILTHTCIKKKYQRVYLICGYLLPDLFAFTALLCFAVACLRAWCMCSCVHMCVHVAFAPALVSTPA